jgi:hypothetical protein
MSIKMAKIKAEGKPARAPAPENPTSFLQNGARPKLLLKCPGGFLLSAAL